LDFQRQTSASNISASKENDLLMCKATSYHFFFHKILIKRSFVQTGNSIKYDFFMTIVLISTKKYWEKRKAALNLSKEISYLLSKGLTEFSRLLYTSLLIYLDRLTSSKTECILSEVALNYKVYS